MDNNTTPAEVAAALAKLLPAPLLAELLNVTVGAEAEPTLTDREAELIAELHEGLCYFNPEAETIAKGEYHLCNHRGRVVAVPVK